VLSCLAATERPYLVSGGSALVRRRIQTPFGAKVLSVVKSEGKVVIGASPPARRRRAGAGTVFVRGIASDAD
jgi:hypothetical protein